MQKNHETKAAARRIVAAILIIVALAAAFFVWRHIHGNGNRTGPTASSSAQTTGLEMDADSEEGGLVYRSQEEIQAELNQKVREGMINISMNTSPVFESGTAKGNIMIVNSEVNNYPQIVYIVRKDTGEEIYRSKGIPVGSKIEYAALSVDLDPGVYECVAYFNNADPQTGAILGTAGAEIVVTVEN